ncbi:MAG: cysteine synthase family protein [Bacillota bacterium]|nr:cysteine synthase family protein [Bacillota bacterium]
MKKFENIRAMVNDTPMLEISLKFQGIERRVYAKAEHYNFTGSIKDRIAYYILKRSYEAGLIKKGDIIAEASSGNTGIALSAMGAYLGNPVHIFMPDWMSKERKKLLESLGARIHLVAKEEGGFKGSIESANKFGAENKAFLPHQFSNHLNIETHYKTTSREILRQLDALGKKPDGFAAGVGTGGTIMGVKKAIRDIYPECKVFPLEPVQSPAMLSGGTISGSHRIDGIGDGIIPEIVELNELDDIICVDDGDAINMARKIASGLGIGVGISSGANLIGVLKAQNILNNPNAVIVTVFPDDNKKYLSTDLMKEQKIKPDYISKDVELLGFIAVK